MTRHIYTLTLILMIGITVEADAKKNRCDKKPSRQCTEKQCCENDRCCNLDTPCCKAEDLNLTFEACLSYEQLLVIEGEQNVNVLKQLIIVPRPEDERPGKGKDQVCGSFKICFEKDFSKAHYQLKVCNINNGHRNLNEFVLGAWLFNDNESASNNIIAGLSPVAFLCKLCNKGNGTDLECKDLVDINCGKKGDICCTGELTNADLNPENIFGPDIPNMVSLCNEIREGNVSVVINGSNLCSPNQTQYGFPSFLLRGIVFAPRMTG